jgi:hypothetical protein
MRYTEVFFGGNGLFWKEGEMEFGKMEYWNNGMPG